MRLREPEPDKVHKGYAWSTAIGLQAVDRLRASKYLIDTAIQNIEGKITMEEVKRFMKKKERTEEVVFMNMCMVYDDAGNVLALDKVSKNYSGTTFPGGHTEVGETFTESVIREIKEETGLTIRNPRLTGIYHWMRDGIRNVGFMYKANEYEGELVSSEEGKVYWISGEEFLKKPLAPGMKQVWQMMHDDNAMECLQTLTPKGIVSKIQ